MCIPDAAEELEKTYLGNVKVVWTNGEFPEPPPYEGQTKQKPAPKVEAQDDLPF